MLRISLLILTMASSVFAANEVTKVGKVELNSVAKEENLVTSAKDLTLNAIPSKASNEEKYQIVANNINAKGDVITAQGDVIIFSETYYITAQKVIYDKKNETFELFDDVVVLKDNTLQTNSNYAFMDMKSENSNQHPLLMLDKNSLLWINSSKSSKNDADINLDSSILSSCNCDDPDWSIKFSSGNYDIEEQWLQTYNNRLYIGSTPVFYIPYFAFPTDNTRRTGLLLPTIGQSSSEGFLYGQPIYYAPTDDFDAEFIPQVRTKRGYGLYSYFRYADSPYSTLYFSAGIFKEKNSYFEEKSLKNQKHYGYTVNYTRNNLFSNSEEHQDGLLIDIDWLNDIEYKNLEDDKHRKSYEKKIESKINYFYKTPSYYTGAYFRHYLDTSLESNKTTLQQMPQLQAHSFSQPVFLDKLMISADAQYTNYTRDEGSNASRVDLSVPIYYSFSLLDDYLKLTLKNETTSSHLLYSNTTNEYNDGNYVENKSIITLGADLLKPYEDYIHTLNFNTDITLPNTWVEDGDLYGINNSDSELDSFSVVKSKKTVAFSLNHSLYDNKDLRQIINHKIKQSIVYDEFNNSQLSDLENDVTFNYILGQFTNRIIYSQEDNTLTESSSDFKFNYDDYFFNATYYMSKDTPSSGKENLESYTFETGLKFLRDYTLSYEQDYNIETQLRSKEAIVLNIDDKCWSFEIEYKKELLASSSTVNNNPTQNDVIYFTFTLKELGGVKYNHKVRGQ